MRQVMVVCLLARLLLTGCATMQETRPQEFAGRTVTVFHNTTASDNVIKITVKEYLNRLDVAESINIEIRWLSEKSEIARMMEVLEKGNTFAFISVDDIRFREFEEYMCCWWTNDKKFVVLCN